MTLSRGLVGSYPAGMSSAPSLRWSSLGVVIGLSLGCAPGASSKDTAPSSEDSSPAPDTDTEDTQDTDDTTDSGGIGPVDEDADGYTSDVDCDDRDPLTHPGATETWNAIDDDCDGRADANGTYTGRAHLATTAIFEGVSYAFALDCPAELVRDGPSIVLTVPCTPDPSDDMAQRLLGETLTWHIETDSASQGSWSGRGTLQSSDGWDIWIDAALTFEDFSVVAATSSRSTVSLSLTATAELGVE